MTVCTGLTAYSQGSVYSTLVRLFIQDDTVIYGSKFSTVGRCQQIYTFDMVAVLFNEIGRHHFLNLFLGASVMFPYVQILFLKILETAEWSCQLLAPV